ncbi:MFS transporter [Microbacterium sp. zg.Y1090]|uniref:MFS transporter n=1 Tax=Microbacterium wangruii TaxID=3049073 RepID=UPI00214AF459|nr:MULTISPECIES: MFS transporter [unclassified Microbacterium]MCR2817535.1 MFS transporter [Microbacterium sp. zg.Y1090]MDL5485822.1 MFS transporter [Microbacterium sp. zg-Y1211]WIM28983.1 MFS transporter [Microbacterium sp. zg-Y1090]
MSVSVAPDDRPVIAHTGPWYFPIAFLARLPFAMMVVGVLTLVVSVTGSVALGGLTSAAVGIGTVLAGPIVGDLVDRHGQRRVLVPLGLANSALLASFPFVVSALPPTWLLLLAALLIGTSAPQAAAMSRSRLMAIIRERLAAPRRARAFSRTMAYESAADETAFVIGPVVVGVLASFIAPWAPIAGAAALSFVFVTAFALHPTARAGVGPDDGPAEIAPARALLRLPVVVLVAATFAVGAFFGATLTSLTSFMAEQGDVDSAALLYGVMGIGSAVLALAVAALPPRFALRWRWMLFAGVLVAATAAFTLSTTVSAVTVALVIMGLGVGPTLVTLFSLAGARAPLGRTATIMTVLGSSVALAQSLASAVTGAIAEEFGAAAAMVLPLVAAALVLVLAVANLAVERGMRRTAVPERHPLTPSLAPTPDLG